jgi:hypothetical protein
MNREDGLTLSGSWKHLIRLLRESGWPAPGVLTGTRYFSGPYISFLPLISSGFILQHLFPLEHLRLAGPLTLLPPCSLTCAPSSVPLLTRAPTTPFFPHPVLAPVSTFTYLCTSAAFSHQRTRCPPHRTTLLSSFMLSVCLLPPTPLLYITHALVLLWTS